MSKPLDLDTARAVALEAAAEAGVDLITPGSQEILRKAAYLAAAAATPLTVDEAATRLSLYVPSWVPSVASLVADAAGVHLDPKRAFIIIGETAWNNPVTVVAMLAHELSHHRRARVVSGNGDTCGTLCAILWAGAYSLHSGVRAQEEATCYSADVTAKVVLGGVSVDDAIAQARQSLAGVYALSPEGLKVANGVLDSVAASLRRGEFHGTDTTIQMLLRKLDARGVDLGTWARVVWS